MIRTLDPKQNQGSGPEVQALKNQLQEKERMLHSLEVMAWRRGGDVCPCLEHVSTECFRVSSQKEMDKTKGQRDYEEKLIVSAWYNMVSGSVMGLLIK